MRTLVINSGSSSIKFSLFETRSPAPTPQLLFSGELTAIATPEAALTLRGQGQPETTHPTPAAKDAPSAIQIVLDTISQSHIPTLDAIGYRVVHPGPRLDRHQRITPQVLEDLQQAVALAPLHDPTAIHIIRAAMARFPNLPHYACFDTVFHQTMPEEASTYAIPATYREQGIHRYGFHGLSCESIVRAVGQQQPFPHRAVIAHLGSGCSITALLDGRSIANTMGLTPTGGIVMGTRPGDLDPGLLLYLLRQQPGDRAQAASSLETLVNGKSGMVALSGLPNDVKAIREAAPTNPAATLALKIFTRSITQAIGSYAYLLGGLDAILFAGGIGEHDPATRADSLANLESFGIHINPQLNLAKQSGQRLISASHSKTAVSIVPAQEDLMIALHVDAMSTPSTPQSEVLR